jgi:hypothetical protein
MSRVGFCRLIHGNIAAPSLLRFNFRKCPRQGLLRIPKFYHFQPLVIFSDIGFNSPVIRPFLMILISVWTHHIRIALIPIRLEEEDHGNQESQRGCHGLALELCSCRSSASQHRWESSLHPTGSRLPHGGSNRPSASPSLPP